MFTDHLFDAMAAFGPIAAVTAPSANPVQTGSSTDGHPAFIQQSFKSLQMLDFLFHHMLDFRPISVPQDGQLAAVNLLRGAFAGMIHT